MSTITSDLQLVMYNSAAESTTSWVTVGGIALNPSNAQDFDAKVQGVACLKVASTGTVYPADSGLAANNFTATNITNKLFFFWRNHTIPTNLPYRGQLGGNSIWISSAVSYNAGNYKIWDLAGSDSDQVGGWNSYAIDPTRTASSSSGALAVSSVISMAFTRKYLTTINSAFDFLDVVRYGTGLKMRDNSGVTGLGGSFNEFFTIDQSTSTAYGVITKNNGIYNVVGKLIVGGWDTGFTATSFASTYFSSSLTNIDSQTALTYFQDNDETIVFKTLPVTTSSFEIRVANTGSYHTVFQLGNYDNVNALASGDVTIRGNVDNGAMSSQQETSVALTAVSMFSTQSVTTGSNVTKIGQSFVCTAIGSKLKSASFWLNKVGAPAGTLTAKLYAHGGTFGTSSTGTGTPLASSNSISATLLSTATQAFYQFTFTGANQYTLVDGTNYVISLELSGTASTPLDRVLAYVAVGTNPGNVSTSTGTVSTLFVPQATQDLVHKLYTVNQAATWRLNAVNNPLIASTATTGTNIIKLYSAYLAEAYSTVLNGNVRSITTSTTSTVNSTTLTAPANGYTANYIVPNMLISGYGIPTATYVTSIDDDFNITMSNTATITITSSTTFSDRSEAISCTWKDFGTITPNGCYIFDSVFQNLNTSTLVNATYAMVINRPQELANISQCKFINAGRAIKLLTSGTYTLTNVTFSGSVYDIDNASGWPVTVNAVSGSNPSQSKTTSSVAAVNGTVGNAVKVNIYRTIQITNVINSSTVRIVSNTAPFTVLAGVSTIGSSPIGITGTNVSVTADPINAGRYVLSYTYGYTADTPVYFVVFATGYQAIRTAYTLQNVDAVYQAGQFIDRQYLNPA